jgi:hypothetical protein
LDANDDDLGSGLVAELDEAFGKSGSGGAGEAQNQDQKITATGDRRKLGVFHGNDLAGEIEIAIAAEAVHKAVPEEMTIRDDRAFDGELVGIEHPKILRRTAVKDQLIAYGGAGLTEADNPNATRKELIGLFGERAVWGEFDHGNKGLLFSG